MGDNRHIHALTGIRGVASFWVLLHHTPNLYPLGEVELGVMGNLFEKGWLGVDLFFVLSGFVISYVYAEQMRTFVWRDAVRFWKLRIARVYPAHVVATLAFAPVYLLAHWRFGYTSENDIFSIPKLLHSLTLTNGWGIPDATGWNLPSWSVSSEWAAYLAFPFITLLVARPKSVAVNVLAIVAIFAVMIGLAIGLNGGNNYTLDWSFTLTRIGSEFTIGCLLFNLFRSCPVHRAFDALAAASLIGIVALSLAGTPPFYDFVLIALFAALVLGLARAEGPTSRLFGSRTLVYLGEISYSVYLIHTVILLVMGQLNRRIWPEGDSVPLIGFAATYGVFVLLSLVAGHLLFRYVEEPGRKWLRKRWIK